MAGLIPLAAAAIIVALAVVIILRWRQLSRPHQLPCPVWMSFLLENSYMRSVAGASILLDRGHVESGMRVLDVGCGAGRLAVPAAERVGPQGEVVAVDVQAGMLMKLERRAERLGVPNIRTVLSGAGEGNIGAGAFDRAFLVTVLGEIPDRLAALREIYTALKPGGLLSVTEVFPDLHFQTRSEVLALAKKSGFAFEEAFGNRLAFTLNLRRG